MTAGPVKQDWTHFYGGRWQEPTGTGRLPVISPIDGAVLGTISRAEPADVERAVAAAREAAPGWAATPPAQRAARVRAFAAVVREHTARLEELDTLDAGIPASFMGHEVERSCAIMEYYAGIATEVVGRSYPTTDDVLGYTRIEPYGVVGQIYPFNHPLMFTLLGAAPALLMGNTVVTKPSEHTSLSSLVLAELAAQVLPAGVFNVVTGDGPTTGNALCAHPGVPRLHFTGSVRGGRAVLAAGVESIKRVSLELGGKNPLLVLADADLDQAADIAVRGMNLKGGSGQSCQSNSRVLVDSAVAADFEAKLVERCAAIRVGDPRDPAVEMGPLAFEEHYRRVLGYVGAGTADGARLAFGGGVPAGLEQGLYLEPTVFADVRPDMRIAREEIFGPVFAVLPCAGPEEMVEIANSLDVGLNARVVCGSPAVGHTLATRLQAGTVWVNESNARPPGMPMGGFKHSGLGNQLGVDELRSYTQEKAVVVRSAS